MKWIILFYNRMSCRDLFLLTSAKNKLFLVHHSNLPPITMLNLLCLSRQRKFKKAKRADQADKGAAELKTWSSKESKQFYRSQKNQVTNLF